MLFGHSAKTNISNKEKFDILYKNYYKYVYKIAFSILKSEKHIDDTVQESFMKIWKSIEKLNINDKEGCKAFISVVTKNTAINKYNKDKKSASNFVEIEDTVLFATTRDDSSDPADIIVNDDTIDYIHNKIKELGDKYSDVMLLKYKYDYTPEEIAELTGINLKTVYTKLSRGREILKSKLSKERGNYDEK